MYTQNQFSCFIIGEGTLPIQCAELLLERGHQILGVIFPDASISSWAKRKDIPYIQQTDNLVAFLSQQPFDYLFSIVNNSVLPKEILELPRREAINYHNALLPRYAGVNATSWALMHGEKTHGVTWHVMTATVDGGNILKQISVAINSDETAFTLNGKCYEAAICSFAQLIDELSSGQVLGRKPNLDQRTYFGRYKRPRAGGVLSFNCCAHDIDAFVRALDFGPYPNRLGLAKLVLGNNSIVVSKLEVLGDRPESPPGTVTAIEPSFVKVATASYSVALHQVLTIGGQVLPIPDLVARFGLHVGYRFKDIEPDRVRRIERFDALIAKHEAFWVERLLTLQHITIPYAHRTVSHLKSKQYASVEIPISLELITFLEKRHPAWNLGEFLEAAFVTYLARIGGTGCFDIGFRDVKLQQEMVGLENLFASHVPCRVNIEYEQSFEEVFEAFKKQVELTKLHLTYGRDVLRRYPALRSLSQTDCEQMFPVVVERVEKLDNYQVEPGNELTLVIASDGKECFWFYNTLALDGDSIARMQDQFAIFLRGIVTDPGRCVAEIPLLSEQERHKILVEWNDTQADYPKDKCIHQLFEAIVEQTPDAVAVVFEDEHLTYKELNQRANQLAHHLGNLGVGPEVLVGICVERSLLMLIGLLGILKAGGAYVPVDPKYPKERIAFMLEDAQVSVLLTQQTLVETRTQHSAQVVYLDADEFAAGEGVDNLTSEAKSTNLAYLLYTSGSTGKPKGVAIEHRSTVALLSWAKEVFSREQLAGVLASTSFCFDISVFELFVPISCGGKVILAENALHLSSLPAADEVTLINTVPSAIAELVRAKGIPERVSTVNLAGEALPQRVVDLLYQQETIQKVFNLYGPSEDTVYSTYALVKRDSQKAPPIGRAISNTQTYILDAYQQPVPIGVPGELHLGGAGLARGYLNRPELTQEKFIPHPFNNEPEARLYKTGDLVRYLPDGNIEFLGRIDHQVKVRGNRIELGEIESVLRQHPDVREVVVTAREDVAGDKRLFAYVVLNQEQAITSKELRRFLKDKLPDYMMPSAFVLLEALPRTPNGKVDRRALPVPDKARPELEETFVAPRTPIEEVLVGIWAEVLALDKVGVQDNFFELGGHSLLATQVISRVRDAFSVKLSLYSLFEASTITSLGEKIEAARREGLGLQAPPILPRTINENLPLSFAQQRLWFLDQLVPDAPIYNIPLAYRVTGRLNVAALEQSLGEIVRRHEALRTTFTAVDGQPIQAIAPEIDLRLPVVDLREIPETERDAEVQRLATQEAQRSFDLTQRPLLRVQLLRLDEAEHVLLLTMHHIVSDGWSLGVLMRELAVLYEAFSTGKPASLPELPIQYADFALWQREWLSGKVLESQLAYWKQQLGGELPVLELPTDRPRPPVQTYRGAKQSFELSKDLTDALKALSQREGVTLFMTLLAVFKTLLYRYTGQEDVIVGSPIANRNWAEIEGLIGFFVNTLVLRSDLGGTPSFRELLGRVREVALGAYAHQDMPFERLVEELQPERDMSYNPLFQVRFVLQNAPMSDWEFSELALSPLEVESKTAKFDLSLSLTETEQGLIGAFGYNTDLFDEATIVRMVGHLRTLLEGVVVEPDKHIYELPILIEERVEWNPDNVAFNDGKNVKPLHSTKPGEQNIFAFEQSHLISGSPVELIADNLMDLVNAAAEQNANRVAVEDGLLHLSYRTLLERVEVIASVLIGSVGLQLGDIVAVCMNRSIDFITVVLAIQKAGCVYMPMSPSLPAQRRAFIMSETKVRLLVVDDDTMMWPEDGIWTVTPSLLRAMASNLMATPVFPVVQRNDISYIVYTSGTTGTPKGVPISQAGICNRITWMRKYYGFSQKDSLMCKCTIDFDPSLSEIFLPLSAGGRIVIVRDNVQVLAESIITIIDRHAITFLNLVPTVLRQMLLQVNDNQCKSLRHIVCGGEAWEGELIRKTHERFPTVALYNGYGPTEASIGVTVWKSDGKVAKSTPPIGSPIDNVHLLIVDNDQQPVEPGKAGELWVGGIAVSPGYIGDIPQNKSFVKVVFNSGELMPFYRTGDLVRCRSDGNIEFLGRIDNQIKLRGFRIELGEIEAALSSHPDVEQALVILSEHIPSNPQLIAYWTPSTSNPSAKLSPSELRLFLANILPIYMLPSTFMRLASFPLKPNGKIDRKALPSYLSESEESTSTTLISSITPLELQILALWQEVFNNSKLGIHDNFFDLGGHSFLATQLIFKLRKTFNMEIPLHIIFEAQTIAELSSRIEIIRWAVQSSRPSTNDYEEERL